MKPTLIAPITVFLALALALPSPSIAQSPPQNSPDSFKSGRIRLVEEVRVSDKDLPENALFQNPRGVAVDGSGNVYVSDFDANHIKVFGPDGKFRTTIGRLGQGPGDLSGPSSIEISGERIIVWEARNRRFSILDMKGGMIRTAKPIHGGWGEILKLRALPDGRLAAFIEKGLPEQEQVRLPSESDYVVAMLSADLEPTGTFYEQNVLNRRWTRHPETQGLIQIVFPYHPRVEADISPLGTAAIGLNRAYEIGLYDLGKGAGKERVATLVRPYAPIKLEERDKQAHFSRYRMVVYVNGTKTVVPKPPDYIVKGTDFPEALPPYRGMIFDGRGRLWVHVFTPGRENNVFDIFGAKGEFLGRIAVEGAGATIDGTFTSGFEKSFAGDYLWKIERDADGFASLVKFRITQ
jgi:NHL repeat